MKKLVNGGQTDGNLSEVNVGGLFTITGLADPDGEGVSLDVSRFNKKPEPMDVKRTIEFLRTELRSGEPARIANALNVLDSLLSYLFLHEANGNMRKHDDPLADELRQPLSELMGLAVVHFGDSRMAGVPEGSAPEICRGEWGKFNFGPVNLPIRMFTLTQSAIWCGIEDILLTKLADFVATTDESEHANAKRIYVDRIKKATVESAACCIDHPVKELARAARKRISIMINRADCDFNGQGHLDGGEKHDSTLPMLMKMDVDAVCDSDYLTSCNELKRMSNLLERVAVIIEAKPEGKGRGGFLKFIAERKMAVDAKLNELLSKPEDFSLPRAVALRNRCGVELVEKSGSDKPPRFVLARRSGSSG
ncbi:hypothetical protein KKG55_00070 [Candidatus Micrarchaeota archaeon]|nr:hypothetical protein [Candidatus Micrarchaeota archaeon]MBU1886101.1 hypothetical protein [Candidatus Micrarchaeota archaeon]